jgi:hypothetical protein
MNRKPINQNFAQQVLYNAGVKENGHDFRRVATPVEVRKAGAERLKRKGSNALAIGGLTIASTGIMIGAADFGQRGPEQHRKEQQEQEANEPYVTPEVDRTGPQEISHEEFVRLQEADRDQSEQ